MTRETLTPLTPSPARTQLELVPLLHMIQQVKLHSEAKKQQRAQAEREKKQVLPRPYAYD